jgi:hypothetical protein
MASSSGSTASAIAHLVAGCDETVRRVVHAFNATGLGALDPHWAGGRPRLISDGDIAVIIATAMARPKQLGMPFTHWSLRKLSTYLRGGYRRTAPIPAHPVTVSRERLRQILHTHRITFQHTRTWKESTDPDFDAKLDRIEHVTTRFPDRCFAFDQFGPLSIRPCHGTCWAARKDPDRIPATYHRTQGIRYFQSGSPGALLLGPPLSTARAHSYAYGASKPLRTMQVRDGTVLPVGALGSAALAGGVHKTDPGVVHVRGDGQIVSGDRPTDRGEPFFPLPRAVRFTVGVQQSSC